jgi:hypothetical protein
MSCNCSNQPSISLYKVFYNLARFFNERILRFILWKTNIFVVPPHFIKFNAIKEYKDKFGIDIIVETGTYKGDTVAKAREVFKEIYSVELDEELFKQAEAKFSCFKNIHIVKGDSAQVLPEIINGLSAPAIFWLDAHYSGGITAGNVEHCPILDEITAILSQDKFNHLILIDDAHLFNGQNGYPELQLLDNFIKQRRPQWKVKIKDNIIRIYP